VDFIKGQGLFRELLEGPPHNVRFGREEQRKSLRRAIAKRRSNLKGKPGKKRDKLAGGEDGRKRRE